MTTSQVITIVLAIVIGLVPLLVLLHIAGVLRQIRDELKGLRMERTREKITRQ